MATAGQVIRTTDLTTIVGADAKSGAATALLALTTTITDITGTSVTFSTTAANAVLLVTLFADVECTAFTSAGLAVAELWVDGAAQSPFAQLQVSANGQRATVGQTHRIVLASAGSHTVLMRGRKSGGTNTINMNATHTRWTGLLIDPA